MKRSVWFPSAVTLAAIVGISFSLASARANTVYDWTLSGASFNGSGTITLGTEETTSNGGGYLATAMTGTINLVGVTSPTNYFGSDNEVYPFATTVVDDFGLGVLLADGDMVAIDPGGPYNVQYSVTSSTYQNEDFTLSLPVTTTPLPAALPLFAGGLGLLGMLARRKKRKAEKALAAAT
jgi:hypothetical protein